MREIEERTFADGITAETLMEEAGRKIAQAVVQFFSEPGRCFVFFGKGNNGGDALVAARHLAREGWEIEMRPAFPREKWGALTAAQHGRAPESKAASRLRRGPVAVLDGLLGIGAGGALREPIRSACAEIARLRSEENAAVFALDIPTGVDGDTGACDDAAVRADFTLAIGFAKTGLLADGAIDHVGRLAVLPLSELTRRARAGRGDAVVATAAALASLLPPRDFDAHKGECGRAGLLAGSPGFTGAAVMCAEGALRGGAGLVMLFVPRAAHALVAAATTPEVMVHAIDSPLELLSREELDVLAIGPGLGKAQAAEVRELIERAPQPMICDADALNILSEDLSPLHRAKGPRLLTPHPGEMARLDPGSKERSRRETAELFTKNFPHTLLLKGARTVIGRRGEALSFNTTGHPGMASGGMGDVTTGVLAALAGQGLSLYDAARLGAWVAGRAAERALWNGGESAESLRATAVLEHLGGAFEDLRRRVW